MTFLSVNTNFIRFSSFFRPLTGTVAFRGSPFPPFGTFIITSISTESHLDFMNFIQILSLLLRPIAPKAAVTSPGYR